MGHNFVFKTVDGCLTLECEYCGAEGVPYNFSDVCPGTLPANPGCLGSGAAKRGCDCGAAVSGCPGHAHWCSLTTKLPNEVGQLSCLRDS